MFAGFAEPDVLVEGDLHVIAVAADCLLEFIRPGVLAFLYVQGKNRISESVKAALDWHAGFSIGGDD